MIILGIDPGTLKTGYGVIQSSYNKSISKDFGVIKTDPKLSLPSRLLVIFNALEDVSEKWKPDIVSIENIFVKDNIRSALLLGHARGAAVCASRRKDKTSQAPYYFEFTPLEIKKALVGQGRATKDQVNIMVKMILNIKESIPEDASDALAAAICAAHTADYKLINTLSNQKERASEL